MKRLTKPGITYNFPKLDIAEIRYLEKIQKRLSSYEDTGLEPENMAHWMDYFRAECEGRLVVLPCKAGDHVWVDGREAVVENFFGYETERYLHAQFYDNMQYIDIPFAEIGKTVFLTREEAEAALEGGKGHA